jgi:shikimate kinase
MLKINFADFDEEIFHDVERPFERIFKIPGIE